MATLIITVATLQTNFSSSHPIIGTIRRELLYRGEIGYYNEKETLIINAN